MSGKASSPYRCSFCGKRREQVRRLIAGPQVYICNECIALCNEMLSEEQQTPDSGARAPQQPTELGTVLESSVQAAPDQAPGGTLGAGHRVWYVPDGYLPPASYSGALQSHEAICVLNSGTAEATVRLTIYFEDREPLRDLVSRIPGERTLHLRLDKPEHTGGQRMPTGVPYALCVESDVPIVVQHSRLDATQPALALFTTMAFPQVGS